MTDTSGRMSRGTSEHHTCTCLSIPSTYINNRLTSPCNAQVEHIL